MLQELYRGRKAIREFLHKGSTVGIELDGERRLVPPTRTWQKGRKEERKTLRALRRIAIRRAAALPLQEVEAWIPGFSEPAREGNPRRFPKPAIALSQADRAERPGQQQRPT